MARKNPADANKSDVAKCNKKIADLKARFNVLEQTVATQVKEISELRAAVYAQNPATAGGKS